MAEFGFKVKHEEASGSWRAGWTVELPHQCDEWQITPDAYKEPVTHAQAVEALEQFIAEAQEALRALREEREVIP
jgi:hypothetical protein